MKFHAVTLALVGTLAAGAAQADHKDDHRSDADRMRSDRTMVEERVDRSPYPGFRDIATHRAGRRSFSKREYTQEWPFYKQETFTYVPKNYDIVPEYIVYFPNLEPIDRVAAKVAEIHSSNAKEAAELRAYANKARSQGWTNIATVYDHIAMDHERTANWTGEWLAQNDFGVPVPATTVATVSADMPLDASVEHMIHMHEANLQKTQDMLRNEKSSTVRGLLISQMTTITRHIQLLRWLDQDVDRGRKDLSARLQFETNTNIAAHTPAEWSEMMWREEYASFTTIPEQPQVVYVIPEEPQPRIVERVVEVERPVERVIEKPVYVERIVERPVYTAPMTEVQTQTVTRSKVAGRRQISGRRMRRPAK